MVDGCDGQSTEAVVLASSTNPMAPDDRRCCVSVLPHLKALGASDKSELSPSLMRLDILHLLDVPTLTVPHTEVSRRLKLTAAPEAEGAGDLSGHRVARWHGVAPEL
jgi:hypothetical protein